MMYTVYNTLYSKWTILEFFLSFLISYSRNGKIEAKQSFLSLKAVRYYYFLYQLFLGKKTKIGSFYSLLINWNCFVHKKLKYKIFIVFVSNVYHRPRLYRFNYKTL